MLLPNNSKEMSLPLTTTKMNSHLSCTEVTWIKFRIDFKEKLSNIKTKVEITKSCVISKFIFTSIVKRHLLTLKKCKNLTKKVINVLTNLSYDSATLLEHHYFFFNNDKKCIFYSITKQSLNLPFASSLQFLLLSAVLEFGLEEDFAELILAPPAVKTEEEFSRCFWVVIGISTGTHFSFLSENWKKKKEFSLTLIWCHWFFFFFLQSERKKSISVTFQL